MAVRLLRLGESWRSSGRRPNPDRPARLARRHEVAAVVHLPQEFGTTLGTDVRVRHRQLGKVNSAPALLTGRYLAFAASRWAFSDPQEFRRASGQCLRLRQRLHPALLLPTLMGRNQVECVVLVAH
jgi:hypothetical protein